MKVTPAAIRLTVSHAYMISTCLITPQDLGLRDYARIDGWVLLPLSTDGMDVRPQGSEEEAEAAEASLLQATQQLQDQLEEVHYKGA